jgi:CRISPR system Cascade subunit CasA
MKPSFNLWTEPWITVERRGGARVHLSIEQTLLDARDLLTLYDSSPLVVVGIRRLLTAILQDTLDPQDEDDLADLWDAGCFPEQAIRNFGAQYAHRFDLFSKDEPFLQSADIPLQPKKRDKRWEIAILFFELPTSTFVAHYRHGLSDDHAFCPACAARGLLTIPPFATSGGAGIKPSINGVPPIYVLPGGATLFERLWASLILPDARPSAASTTEDAVWWRHAPVVDYKAEVHEIGYLHSLTFPARRVRLHPERIDTPCTRCGATSDWGVRTMVYQMGESRPRDAPFWQDPFAAYRVRGDAPTPIRPQQGKALWREFAALFLPTTSEEGKKEHTLPPSVLYQRGELAANDIGPDYGLFPVRCVGLRTDMKAKIFEWLDTGFDVPTSLLRDVNGSDVVRQGIDLAAECARSIARTFRQTFGRAGAEHHVNVKNRMVDAYWAALADPFRTFVNGAATRETRKAARVDWVERAVAEGKAAFRAAAESVGDNVIALRQRVEGVDQCHKFLNIIRKKALGKPE